MTTAMRLLAAGLSLLLGSLAVAAGAQEPPPAAPEAAPAVAREAEGNAAASGSEAGEVPSAPAQAAVPKPAAPPAPAGPTAAQAGGAAADSAGRHEGSPSRWTGPRVALGYRLYSLTDDAGGGAVQSATFSGFLPTRFVRAGGGLEAGGRAYEYGPTEGLFSGNAFVGYQHLRDLGPFVPYLVAVGELGFVLSKRFHTPRTNLLRGAGIEIGANVNVVRSFYVGLGLSYMMYSLDGLAYDSFGLRLSLGL